MELLTGKCKETAKKFIYDKHRLSYTESFWGLLHECMQHALLMEFFDSVGIYIDSKFVDWKEGWFCVLVNGKYIDTDNGMPINHFSNRPEATKAALIHANDLFNDKH